MEREYWTLFLLGILGILFSVLLDALIFVLTKKKVLSKRYFFISTAVLIFAILLGLCLVIRCVKDYEFISTGNYFEEDAVVVEFTHVERDSNGTGKPTYSSPKFYIESKDEYVILHAADVEIGKKYRIRYLPNTKICEILYCIEE